MTKVSAAKKRRCFIVTVYLLRWNTRHRRLPSQRVRKRDLLLLQSPIALDKGQKAGQSRFHPGPQP